MKKLAILFVAFFVSGALFAQSNLSTSTQTGTGHVATVDQTGLSNGSDVIQDQGFTYGVDHGSTADIEQTGELNSSYVNSWGWNHEVYTTQTGDENLAGVNQRGGENDAFIDQTGDKNTVRGMSAGSVAYQKAGDPFGGDKNMFDIDQIGDENTVGMSQSHSAEATVLQKGYKNRSEVEQTGPAFGAVNYATVSIKGDENITDMYQKGDGNSASAVIGSYVSSYNEVDMDQDGDGNKAIFGLTGGDDNYVKVDQLGDANYTEYSIKYGSDNSAIYDVDGAANRSRFKVKAGWGSSSDGNALTLTQDGEVNYATGKIEGDGNTVDMSQVGDDNRIGTSWYTTNGVKVLGDFNTTTISQSGAAHMSSVFQTGDFNTAIVTQTP